MYYGRQIVAASVEEDNITVTRIDASLDDWDTLDQNYNWKGILIGNGASRTIWDKFKYSSLYEAAASADLAHPLLPEDQYIFDQMDTTNFEQVLAGLATSEMICDVLSMDAALIRERYESIQRALFEAVSMVHLPWKDSDSGIYSLVREALRSYDFVFSTNYDLIIYWSMMTEGGGGFKDYFFSRQFDLADTEIWGGSATKVLYLHGGIHLAKTPSGATIKRRAATEGMNLIESLEFIEYDGLVPLFVTEGKSIDKLSSIHRSDYLSFAYQQFAQHSEPLVVFGNSLGLDGTITDGDHHLIDAMRRQDRQIAISIYPTTPKEIIAYKAELHKKLPRAELLFFDSTTHPLGASRLSISE